MNTNDYLARYMEARSPQRPPPRPVATDLGLSEAYYWRPEGAKEDAQRPWAEMLTLVVECGHQETFAQFKRRLAQNCTDSGLFPEENTGGCGSCTVRGHTETVR